MSSLKFSLLRQHLTKCQFPTNADRHTAFAMLDDLAASFIGPPAAWANGEQLRLCSVSPREVRPENPLLHNLPRNIAGSALPSEYCDTPLYLWPYRRKLEIEDDGEGAYGAWMTDTDGNLHTLVCYDHPYAAADWCERNGFAWEVIGAVRDPVAALAAWRAEQ